MKVKPLKTIFLVCIILCVSIPVYADTNNVILNDTITDVECIYDDNDASLVPVRAFCEMLGYNVSWNSFNGAITISKTADCLNAAGVGDIIILVADKPGITVWNSSSLSVDTIDTLSSCTTVIDGTAYCSVFYLCRALDVKLKPRTEDNYIRIYTR